MQKLIALLLRQSLEGLILILNWSHIPWFWYSRRFPRRIKHQRVRGTGKAFSTWERRRRRYTQQEYLISKRISTMVNRHFCNTPYFPVLINCRQRSEQFPSCYTENAAPSVETSPPFWGWRSEKLPGRLWEAPSTQNYAWNRTVKALSSLPKSLGLFIAT